MFAYLEILFRIAWWTSAGKELTSWLFAYAVLLYEGLDMGVWNSLISKNLAHYSLSLNILLIL